MLKLASILSWAAVLVCLALTPAAEAQNNNTSPALGPPPLTCDTSAGTVRVTAQTQGGVFPVPAACPANTLGVTNCLRWTYEFRLLGGGNNISLSAITADSDVDIVAATGQAPPGNGSKADVLAVGTSDNAIGGYGQGVFDFRTVRFSANSAVVLGNIFTRTNVEISTVTAIAKVGNTGATTCAIAGVGNINNDSAGFAGLGTGTQVDQWENCQLQLNLDSKGCTQSITVTQGSCNVEEVLTIGGEPIQGGPCNKPSGFKVGQNSCIWYCPTSAGTCWRVCK